jgi:hypothetical protein
MKNSGEQLPLQLQFERWPIDGNRRLIPQSAERALHMSEFYDTALGSRVISMQAGGEEARFHEELHEERMPVFSAMYRDKELLLLVPEGSRTLRKTLHLIARDMESYGEIFFGLGKALGQLDTSPFGLPEVFSSRSILESFAFSHDDQEPFGGKIYLIPPYRLEPIEAQKKRDHLVDSVYEELIRSRYFSQEAASWLMDTMADGWQSELFNQQEE